MPVQKKKKIVSQTTHRKWQFYPYINIEKHAPLFSSKKTHKQPLHQNPQTSSFFFFFMYPNFTGKPLATGAGASHHGIIQTDLDRMAETPNRTSYHRRSQSETFFRFPSDDDILLDDVVADFNFANIDLPSLSSDAPVPTTTGDSSSKSEGESSDAVVVKSSGYNHSRSLSVDADFFNGIGDSVLMMVDNSKKALAPDKLAELALIDPKRAKRFNLFLRSFTVFVVLSFCNWLVFFMCLWVFLHNWLVFFMSFGIF